MGHQPGDNRTMVWHNDPNRLYNGFLDMTLEKSKITIEGISHGGQLRRTLVMEPAFPHHPLYDEAQAKKAAKEAKEKATAWTKKHAAELKAKEEAWAKAHKKSKTEGDGDDSEAEASDDSEAEAHAE